MHVFSEISPTFEFSFAIGPNSLWSSKTFNASACQHFFSLPISNSNSIAAMVAMGASNVHKCTRVYPQTYTCMGKFVWYICTPICRGYANAWFCHYSSIHQIPHSFSLFHCTLIARLISLSNFACGYLCMRILPSTALSVTHTHGHTVGQPQSAPPLAYWLLRARA